MHYYEQSHFFLLFIIVTIIWEGFIEKKNYDYNYYQWHLDIYFIGFIFIRTWQVCLCQVFQSHMAWQVFTLRQIQKSRHRISWIFFRWGVNKIRQMEKSSNNNKKKKPYQPSIASVFSRCSSNISHSNSNLSSVVWNTSTLLNNLSQSFIVFQ